ncbi:MAG: hypothetical protein JNM24_01540 [Bdellovibrionaceae bacterium]|nr:hypothetical protein [Pseudobdellovibrionaceae bacterium]
MKLILIYLVLFFTAFSQANELTWNLNDVSYLMKIPNKVTETTVHLLSPYSKGSKGELLPHAIFQRLPTLNNAGNGMEIAYKQELKVVSIRIDPCPNSFDPSLCQPEIRLIWQPLEIDRDENRWFAQDAAVHTFYKLNHDQFATLKKELWQLKMINQSKAISTHKLPLQVHPALLNETTAQNFNKTLNTILLKNCGEENLVKVTFMSLLTPNVWWRFGGIVPGSAKWENLKIPRLIPTFQDIFNSAFEPVSMIHNPGVEMDAIFNIHPDNYPENDNIFEVINRGFRYNDDNDYPVFKNKLDAVERFRNPHFSNPNTLDCASCHYADATKFYSEKRFPTLKDVNSYYAFKNPNSSLFNLENNTIAKEATRVVRAFGYFDNKPAINQRTINDSAESAHWLNTKTNK